MDIKRHLDTLTYLGGNFDAKVVIDLNIFKTDLKMRSFLHADFMITSWCHFP